MDDVLILSEAGIRKFLITIFTNMSNISSMALYLFIIILGVVLVISLVKMLIQ